MGLLHLLILARVFKGFNSYAQTCANNIQDHKCPLSRRTS